VRTGCERQELQRLCRENRQLKVGRDILSRAAAWFAGETKTVRRRIPIREREPGVHPVATMCRVLGAFAGGFHAFA